MPRRPRPLAAGAVYHVTARGVRGLPIFRDDADRRAFIALLDRTIGRHGWHSLSWCLMSNHVHLLVRTPGPDLSMGMQSLLGDYARRFNHRHDTFGHLFQGRFGSVLIRTDSQLLVAARYIALNPVKAGICDDPAAYCWSSHRATLGLVPPVALTTDALLGHFGADGGAALERYADFVGGSPPTALDPHVLGPALDLPRTAEALDGDDRTALRRAFLEEGLGVREIAAATGLSPATVSRRLKQA
jgi:REP element-mobilizing transposase RayT